MGPLMSCSDADALIAAFAVGSLDDEAVVPLRRHLAGCPDCGQVAVAYSRAAGQLPLALEPVPPAPALRSRIMAAVYADAAGTPRQIARRPSWRQRAWSGVPAARGWTLAGGLATAAALVGLASLGMAGRHTPPAAGPASMPISGTTARPLAHGQLSYDISSHSAVLTVDGLGPQPTSLAGSTPTYEVWLIDSSGAAEPAAYLSPEPRGTSWSGAFQGDMRHFRALAVTLEPSEGRLSPSGPEVLRTDLNPLR